MRKKIVVLDANFLWTKELFSAASSDFDVLLLKPLDFRSFFKRYRFWNIRISPKLLNKHIWELVLCMPPGWLFNIWPLTELILGYIIKSFIKNDKSAIIVLTYPYYNSIWSLFPHSKKVYYCFDYYNDYWPGRTKHTILKEEETIVKADRIICTAYSRKQFFDSLNPKSESKILHIPHGTSERFFNIMDFNNWKKNVGYIGSLNERFDFQFLFEVASQMPEIQFNLGGILPDRNMGSQDWFEGYLLCRKLKNVNFMGFIENKDIPSILSNFNVLIMPYSICDFNTYACPMKLWDYLATGIPMLANSAVPEILSFKEVVKVAVSPMDFVKELNWLLDNKEWKRQERLNIALQNSWENQFEKIISRI